MRNITQHGIWARIALTALALCLIAGPAASGLAEIIYVDITRTAGANNGSSWSDAYQFFQDGLYHPGISSGDTIRVAGGTYFPDDGDDVQPGEEAEKFRLKNGVRVEGGYHGYCPAFCGKENDRDDVSILSGDIDGTPERSAGDSRHVIWAGTLAAATVLDGFTIEWGNADETSEPDCDGGGLYVLNCTAFTALDCTFRKNHADEFGGAVVVTFNSGAPADSLVTFDRCDFDDNDSDNDGGAIFFYAPVAEPDQDITVLDCDFTNNKTLVADDGRGAGILINGADEIIITDCEFIGNHAASYSALTIAPRSVSATITRCLFDDNTAGASGGGAYVSFDGTAKFDDCTFKDNTSVEGGGALWALVGRNKTFTVDLKKCKFLRNEMTGAVTEQGGGGVFFSAAKYIPNVNHPTDGILKGTWTNCDFVENDAERGGGAYIQNSQRIDIEDCRFIGNTTPKAGGGIGIADLDDFNTVEVYICKSQFISNTATQGGAVHNHEGAETYMVNCVIAGNSATLQGGGVFNSRHTAGTDTAKMYMHNCLIAGNEANGVGSTGEGGGVYSGLGSEEDEAVMELINCTLVGNYADDKWGGVVNAGTDNNSLLVVRNCIAWDNTDSDGGTSTLDAQVAYETTLIADDVDNGVIEGCTDCFETDGGTEDNTGDNPDFASGVSSLSWTGRTYDADTGQTTFNNLSGLTVNEHVNKLFKPDKTEIPYLLIISNTATKIVCLGWSGKETGPGAVFSPLLCTSYGCGLAHAAEDFGDADHLPLDVCDVNGDDDVSEVLPYDLYDDDRNQDVAPDAGVHEVDPG